jgi:peptide/nickel transport system ATP-binding protein
MTPLIEVKNLKKYFPTGRGMLHAVDDVSFSVGEGKTIGVVGESGCGKSTLGRTIIHLLESTGGSIYFRGEDITKVKSTELKKLREDMQIIFQDPYSSLDPRQTVKDTVKEPLITSKKFDRQDIDNEARRLMELVGIDKRLGNSYPHELDGGRRQRIGIARALALNPKFVVCDEPVSALDVSIQAQVLNLLKKLQQQLGLTYMFVTHDLSVVRHISNDICVMYLGQVIELSPSKELFRSPTHPYTRALLSAIPSVDIHHQNKREILKGEITSPINPKPGCRFAARCRFTADKCKEPQTLKETGTDHFVACCRVDEINLPNLTESKRQTI